MRLKFYLRDSLEVCLFSSWFSSWSYSCSYGKNRDVVAKFEQIEGSNFVKQDEESAPPVEKPKKIDKPAENSPADAVKEEEKRDLATVVIMGFAKHLFYGGVLKPGGART
eukprot:Gb_09912 [translate_table: standard]